VPDFYRCLSISALALCLATRVMAQSAVMRNLATATLQPAEARYRCPVSRLSMAASIAPFLAACLGATPGLAAAILAKADGHGYDDVPGLLSTYNAEAPG
jgi:hypothetical protein